MDWNKLKYFTLKELGGEGFDYNTALWLDTLREEYGKPIKINSGYRSPDHPLEIKKKNGPGAHTEGKAVDIHCTDSRDRFLLVSLAIGLGCNRVGIGDSFIHLDLSKVRDQRVMWTYSK